MVLNELEKFKKMSKLVRCEKFDFKTNLPVRSGLGTSAIAQKTFIQFFDKYEDYVNEYIFQRCKFSAQG